MADRQIMLDTETTGLDYKLGDRVIEIGCIELVGRKQSRRTFHQYLNPDREIDPGAQAVHGISSEFLADKPRFNEVANDFIEFIRGAELVIHNAGFDVGFLNNELSLAGLPPLEEVCSGVLDTLKLAREMRPGKKNSLDALCNEYSIDNSGRTFHGALLDAQLLAEVYLSLTRGQDSLLMDLDAPAATTAFEFAQKARPVLRVLRASDDEIAAHEKALQEIDKESKGSCLWLAQEAPADAAN
ncbi:MAG TPA: DNA polymerase III subunit epsilon [Rhodocyclaceae bacterium]|nr:DNA polymerase III subunit epsilon [Rhodocyclaceae bacterium]